MSTMNFIARLSLAPEKSDDIREKAKAAARERLRRWRSAFAELSSEQAAEIAASKESATTGVYDPEITHDEAAE